MSLLLTVLLWMSTSASAGGYGSISMGRPSIAGDLKGVLEPGRQAELVVGADLDKVVVGGVLRHAVHHGCHYELQASGECGGLLALGGVFPIQGSTAVRTLGATLALPALLDAEQAKLGIDLTLGVVRAPLLMDEDYYEDEVVRDVWDGVVGSYHDSPMPFVAGGIVLARPLRPIGAATSAPELYLKVEMSLAGSLGRQITPSAGVRVRRGS